MQLRLSGQYCDVVAIRCFADLKIKKSDTEEKIFNGFSKKYLNKPLISMEAAETSFAEFMDTHTIKRTNGKKPENRKLF